MDSEFSIWRKIFTNLELGETEVPTHRLHTRAHLGIHDLGPRQARDLREGVREAAAEQHDLGCFIAFNLRLRDLQPKGKWELIFQATYQTHKLTNRRK